MIVSAHQTAYLPWLGYFHKIAISDVFVILDEVQFEKNSFINRNKIKSVPDCSWLTVPVLISGHMHKTIADLEINNGTNWNKKHWKSIYFNYKKAPYFREYADYFEDFYKHDWRKLVDATEHVLLFLIKELRIKTAIYKQSELRIQNKKQQLILDICDKFHADAFVFGALGRDYVDRSLFESQGINVYFQDYKHPIYPQLFDGFVGYLSFIDLLFNVGGERAAQVIMEGNVTKEELKSRCPA